MTRKQIQFVYLNVGHFLDHLFMLIFASVAALSLTSEWGISYSELIPYATPGFIAFGACALIAGWLADKWNREGMMTIFFIGIGASSIFSGFAESPFHLAIGLTLIGIFAAIYHPVGLAMVIEGRNKIGMPLAVNGLFGNMGVASAALMTGMIIDITGWRSAFIVPGFCSIVIGVMFLRFTQSNQYSKDSEQHSQNMSKQIDNHIPRNVFLRIFSIIFFTTAIGGLIFQSTTFSLPKVFDETLSASASSIGWYSFIVFSVAALAQLVVGHIVDKHPIRLVFVTVAFMQCVLFGLMTQLEGIASFIVSIGFMLFVFGQIPINDVLVGRAVRSEWRSRAYAIRYVVTFSVMATAVPLIGWIHGIWGFEILFSILSVAALFIFFAALFLPGNDKALSAPAAT